MSINYHKTMYKIISFLMIFFVFVLLNNSVFANKGESDWFETYDINDTEKVWEMIIRPITVLDAPEKKEVYLLDSPNGKRIKKDKLGGYIWGSQAGIRVLGEDEDGYTLIEGYDEYDRLLQGYVKTSLIKEAIPNQDIGIVIDKLTQRLYVFEKGKMTAELLVSTGLVNKDQPYNETASGEYLITSWVGDFWSGNMLCRKAIRYNGGDLIHYVPAFVNKDGSFNYSPFTPKLGSKASHGCVRVQEAKDSNGYNMEWLWNNLKRNSKVLIWDDTGREQPYPDDYTILYYNPKGGKNYHSIANCHAVKDRYLPLSPFYYGQMRDTEPYKNLTPCPHCTPVDMEIKIDEKNTEYLDDEKYSNLMERRKEIHDSFDPFNPPQEILNNHSQLPTAIAPKGVQQPYPDDYSLVYYNPKGGKNYHAAERCSHVRESFLPLTGIYYGQLRSDDFNKLTPCPYCNPPHEEKFIDEINKKNLSDSDFAALMKQREQIHATFNPSLPPTSAEEFDEEASNEIDVFEGLSKEELNQAVEFTLEVED